jgi:hypothetical protein
MRCKNAGSDYDENNIQWTCTASLPEEFKLGSTDVICEGYDYPEDPYILKGSCAVEYRLVLTDKGHTKYGKGSGGGWSPGDEDGGPKTLGQAVAQALFWLAFIGVACWILYSAYQARQQGGAGGGALAGNRPGWGGGGGGGGWDGHNNDHDDSPPPPYYDTRPGSDKQNYSSTTPGSRGWRPGFWTGAAGGAAATYAANQWGNQNQTTGSGSRWGGGGGGGGGGWDNGEGSSGSSNSSFSSTRHESTGFGSTSRR